MGIVESTSRYTSCWRLIRMTTSQTGVGEDRMLVEYNVDSGIAVVTLNDPPANTYSYEMMQQFDRAILKARMDEAVQVIVITGQGDKFFCAGADIQMLA